MTSMPEPAVGRHRAPLRLIARAALILTAIVIAVVIALHTAPGMKAVVNLVLAIGNPWPATELTVAGARGGFVSGMELYGLRFRRLDGPLAVDVDTLTVRYRLFELVGSSQRVREISAAGARLVVTQDLDGLFDVERPLSEPAPMDFTLSLLSIRRGQARVHVLAVGRDSVLLLDDVNLAVSQMHVTETISLTVDTLSAVLRAPGPPVTSLRLAGSAAIQPGRLMLRSLTIDGERTRVTADGTLALPTRQGVDFAGTDFRVRVDPLAGIDVERFLPMLGDPGDIVLALDARGDSSTLHAIIDARADRGGHVNLEAQLAGVGGSIAVQTDGHLRGLDLGALMGKRPDSLVVDAEWSMDIAGLDLGTVSGPFALNLSGTRVGDIRLQEARIEGDLERGRATLEAVIAAEGIRVSAEGWATPFGSPIEYDLAGAGSFPGLQLVPDGPIVFAGLAPFRVQGSGTDPEAATATVAVDLESEQSDTSLIERGRFRAALEAGLATWQLELGIASGNARAEGEVRLADGPSFRVRGGEISGVEVAAFVGDKTHSRLDASFTAAGRGTHPDSVRATAQISSLTAQYGIHEVRNVSALLRLDDGRATLEANAIVDSARVVVWASVAPVLHPRDARVDVDFRDLDLARVVGDTAWTSRIAGKLETRISGPDLAGLLAVPSDSRASARTRGSLEFELEPSVLLDENVDLFEIRGNLAAGSLSLDGRMESSFGNLQLAGVVRPFDAAPTAELECKTTGTLDLAALLDLEGQRAEVRGRLIARTVGIDPNTAEAHVVLDLAGSRIRDLTLDEMTVRADYLGGALDTRVDIRAGEDSAVVVLNAETLADPIPVHASASVQFEQLEEVVHLDSLDVGLGLAFEIDGVMPRAGTLHDIQLAGWIAAEGHAGDARADSLVVVYGVRDGMVHVSRLVVHGSAVEISGEGQVALPRADSADSTSFRMDGQLNRVGTLARLLGVRDLAASYGSFRLRAAGPSRNTRLTADIQLRRPHLADYWADSLSVVFTGVVQETTLAEASARVAARALVPWPFLARDLDATLEWDGRELSADIRSIVDGDRRQHVVVRLEPREEGIRGRLERVHQEGPTGTIVLQAPVDFELGDRLFMSELVLLADGTPRLRAWGGFEGDTVAFEAHLDSLNLNRLRDIAELGALQGSVSLDVSLAGTRQRPVVDASAHALLIVGKRKPAVLDGRLAWADSTLDLVMSFDQTAKNRLTVRTRLPLALQLDRGRDATGVTLVQGSMRSELRAEHFDLSWFEPLISPRVLRRPRGWLDGTVVAEGDPRMPAQSGYLALSQGEVELPALGVRYRKAEARVRFDDRTITLERARVESGGNLEASGTVTLRGPDHRVVDLEATFQQFRPMNTLGAKVELDGGLAVSGNLHAPNIRGDLTLRDTNIYAAGDEAASVEQVRLGRQDRLDLRERFGISVDVEAPRGYPWADSADVDVSVAIGESVWISRRSDPVVSLEMEGAVRVRKPRGQPVDVRGSLGIRSGRSYLSFVGRRFDIVDAQVYMPGPVDSVRLELEAFHAPSSSTSADVNVTANVIVDANGVATDLRAEPYLEPAALLNYLATGQVEGGVQSGTAYGLAVGTALGAVGGAAGRRIGLDVVQVTMDAYGGQTLAAGSYIDPRLYLGFRQPVVEQQTSRTSLTSGSTLTEFEIELSATRNLLLNLQGSSQQYRFLLRPRLGR